MSGIKKNFVYNSLLTTANYIFPLITYPYISRVLGVEKIGVCSYVDSIVNYFILFSMLGMTSLGVREIAAVRNDISKRSRVFSSLLCLNFFTTVIAILGLFICINSITSLSIYKELLYIGAIKIFFNFCLIEWLFKGLEDFKYITIRSVLVRALYTISIFFVVKDVDDYTLYFLLTALTIVLNGIINLTYSKRFVKFSFKELSVKSYIKPFVIFGVYFIITSMYTTFNTFYLGYVTSPTEVGYYSTSHKIYSLIIALFTAFTGVMMPKMTSLLSEGKESAFKSYILKSEELLVSFAVPLIIASFIFSPEIITLLAGPGYDGAITPMRIVLPLVFVIGYEQVLIVQVLTPLKKDKIILRNSILGATVGLVLNIILVRKLASIGSSIVWLCSEIAVMLSAHIYLRKNKIITFPFKFMLKNIFSYIPAVILSIMISLFIESIWCKLLCASILFALSFIIVQVLILKNEMALKLIVSIKSHIKKF